MGFCTRCLTSYGECLTAESICIRCAEKDLKNLRAEVERLEKALRKEKESRRKIEAHLLWGRNILSGILYEPAGGAAQAECLAAARLWLPRWVNLNAALAAPEKPGEKAKP